MATGHLWDGETGQNLWWPEGSTEAGNFHSDAQASPSRDPERKQRERLPKHHRTGFQCTKWLIWNTGSLMPCIATTRCWFEPHEQHRFEPHARKVCCHTGTVPTGGSPTMFPPRLGSSDQSCPRWQWQWRCSRQRVSRWTYITGKPYCSPGSNYVHTMSVVFVETSLYSSKLGHETEQHTATRAAVWTSLNWNWNYIWTYECVTMCLWVCVCRICVCVNAFVCVCVECVCV